MSNPNSQCAPNSHNNDFSCFDRKSLDEIATIYNKSTTDPIKIPSSLSNIEVWNKLKLAFYNEYNCDNETCWLEQGIMNTNKGKYSEYFKR